MGVVKTETRDEFPFYWDEIVCGHNAPISCWADRMTGYYDGRGEIYGKLNDIARYIESRR